MNLKNIRKSKGITYIEACKRIKIGTSTLNRYENLQRFPDNKILKRIQEFYKLTDEQILLIFLDYFKNGR